MSCKCKIVIRIILLATVLCLLPFGIGGNCQIEASAKEKSSSGTVKKGLVKQDGSYYYYKSSGKKLKNSWKTIDGKKYYFTSDGSAATGGYKIKGTVYVFSSKGRLKTGKKARFLTISGHKYYVDKKGRAKTGWFVVNNHLYYAAKKTGRISTKTREVNGSKIKFNQSKGYAKISSKENADIEAKLKRETVKVLQKVTTSGMSKKEKLKACWNYLVGSGWHYQQYDCSFSSGWQKKCAYKMLSNRRGDCKSWACAFAALACEIGYDAYVIRGNVPAYSGGVTSHAWVRINGKYYDPEGQWDGWNKDQYESSSYNADRGVKATYRFNTY